MSRQVVTEYVSRREIDKMLSEIDERQEVGGKVGIALALIGALTIATGFSHPFTSAAIASKVTVDGIRLTRLLNYLSDFEDILLAVKDKIQDGMGDTYRMTVTYEYWKAAGIDGWVPIKVSGQVMGH